MLKKLKKLMLEKAKEGKILKPKDKQIKSEMLDEIEAVMNGKMSDEIKDLQKVTVMAESKEGLEEGLEKAGDILSELPEEECEEMDEDDKKASKKSNLSKIEELKKLIAKKEG